jgi:hypothetical protein
MRPGGLNVKMLVIVTYAPGQVGTRLAHQPIGAGP